MDEPLPSSNAGTPAHVEGAEFDDPALAAAFGLDSPSDWILRARQSESPTPPPGRLGPYELLEEIGRGGQGVVYKAVQPGTGRTIAIKRIAGGHSLSTRSHTRFAQEIQALCRLHHPSIVTVHGAEDIDGAPTLLMEHIAGVPIDRWADGPPPNPERLATERILPVFAQVCDAVAHAHQRGVIHRDLKPSNVLVDETGLPRVLDFGIAHLVDDLHGRAAETPTLTCFAGTPAYSSPEQLDRPTETDTRSDVYSLGALLYRLLTGVQPFPRDLSLPALIDAVRSGIARRPSLVCPTLTREIDWIVLKAMSPDPALRYQTVDALAADVRRFLNREPVTAHPPSRLYTAAKFIGRHAVACSAAALAAAAILSLATVSIAQTVRVNRQNVNLTQAVQRADSEALAQRQLTQAMGSIIEKVVHTATRVPRLSRKELMALIEPELEHLVEPETPEAKVQFHILRAKVARSAGNADQTVDYWARAIAAEESLPTPNPQTLARLHDERGEALCHFLRYPEAWEDGRAALNPAFPAEYFRALGICCTAASSQANFEVARAMSPLMFQVAGKDRKLRAVAYEAACNIEFRARKFSEARRLLDHTLADMLAEGLADTLETARVRIYLANLYLIEGDVQTAEKLANESAQVRLRAMGPLHSRTAESLLVRAEALSRLGRFAEAAECLEQLQPRHEAAYGSKSKHLACFRFALAAAHLGAANHDSAGMNLALAVSRGTVSQPDHKQVAADVAKCRAALIANGFLVNPRLSDSLGALAWLTDLPASSVPNARLRELDRADESEPIPAVTPEDEAPSR